MKILIDEEVVKQALDKMNQVTTLEQEDEDILFDAIAALRSALQAEKVEPVAHGVFHEDGSAHIMQDKQTAECFGKSIPLYAAPTPPTNTDELDLLRKQVRGLRLKRDKMIEYLERVCGDRCNAEYNPCEAKDLLNVLCAAEPTDELREAARAVVNTAWIEDMMPDEIDRLRKALA